MIGFSKRTDYGFLALGFLARLPEGQRANARLLAETLGVPPELMAKVLQSMAKVGFIGSQMGPGGGYNLVLSPSEISVADVIAAIEGPISLTQCLSPPEECTLAECCTIRRPMGMIQEKLVELLDSITLEDMWSAHEGVEEHELSHIHG